MFRPGLILALLAAVFAYEDLKNKPTGKVKSAPYIVGGEFVNEVGRWQSMCSLQNAYYHWCGASLISDSWLLTAAHCVTDFYPRNMNVVCGILDHWDHSIGSMEVHEIEYWEIHDDYSPDFAKGFANDMALVKLKFPINPYNPYVKPVDLAENDGSDWVGSECHAVGWGQTAGDEYQSHNLKQAQLDVIDLDECRQYWGSSVNHNHVCAKDTNTHDKGACNGDSGGPLYCSREGKLYQVGVFNWMAGGCDPYYPAMYSSVPLYRSWIKQYTGI